MNPYTTTDAAGKTHVVQLLGPAVPGNRTRCGQDAQLIQRKPWQQINCPVCLHLAGRQPVRPGAQGQPHHNGPTQRPHIHKP